MKNIEDIGGVIEKYKKYYQKFDPTFCSVLDDKIYFNMAGFKHLISKTNTGAKIALFIIVWF